MTIKTDFLQVGVSPTAANDFILNPDGAGNLKIQRGMVVNGVPVPTQDIATIDAAGNITIASGVVKQSKAKRNFFSAYLPANFGVLPTNVFTLIRAYTKLIDSAGTFDPTTNGRFQPNVAGWYRISAGATIVSDPATIVLACIFKNGANCRRVGGTVYSTGGSANSCFSGSFPVYLNGTSDYVDFRAYTNGANTYVYGDANGEYSTFSGELIEAD